MGKQTETLTRQQVRDLYPRGVGGFHGRPGDVIPRYAGKRYQWRIGETTDDTEQTIAVARALLAEGEAKHEAVGRELLRCGAIAGAMDPQSVNEDWFHAIESVEDTGIVSAADLLAARWPR